MEILAYGQFLLVKNLRKRIRLPFLNIKCIGIEDGERLEIYTNGKLSGNFIVQNGGITVPICKGNNYRLASPNHPYGVRFNTTDAHDGTDDILLFQTISTEKFAVDTTAVPICFTVYFSYAVICRYS